MTSLARLLGSASRCTAGVCFETFAQQLEMHASAVAYVQLFSVEFRASIGFKLSFGVFQDPRQPLVRRTVVTGAFGGTSPETNRDWCQRACPCPLGANLCVRVEDFL